jgi:hypothetical protein
MTRGPNAKEEANLSNEGSLRVGGQADVRLFRNNVGTLLDKRGVPVKFGLAPGSADHVGLVAPHGRFLSIEWKKPGYTPPSAGTLANARSHRAGCKCEACHYNAQLDWRDTVRKFGGVAGIVDNVADALALVEEARRPAKQGETL